MKESESIDIYFRMDGKGQAKLLLKDVGSGITYYLLDNELLNQGLYRKRIPSRKLSEEHNLNFEYFYKGEKYEAKFGQ
ncbi:MAG: hypothetical protein IPL20_13350 [Saprospiraceae bacterium]|nr:hypothetical protein [Saprospiraceae bacterium]